MLADFKVPIQVDTEIEFKAIVVSANDYYPFGMVMEGRKYRDENYDYRYGFNGKEDDKDFGDKQLIQDYGFRLYNPAIARFLSVDPLAPSFPWYTPYQFAGNKPIWAIDLDGLEELTAVDKQVMNENSQLKVENEKKVREMFIKVYGVKFAPYGVFSGENWGHTIYSYSDMDKNSYLGGSGQRYPWSYYPSMIGNSFRYQIRMAAAYQQDLDPYEFYTAAMGESLGEHLDNVKNNLDAPVKNASSLLGLDGIADEVEGLIKQGYLDSEFINNANLEVVGGYNEIVGKTNSFKIGDTYTALRIFAARYTQSRDIFIQYAESKGYKRENMSKQMISYWTYVFFNQGNGHAKEKDYAEGVRGGKDHFDSIGLIMPRSGHAIYHKAYRRIITSNYLKALKVLNFKKD